MCGGGGGEVSGAEKADEETETCCSWDEIRFIECDVLLSCAEDEGGNGRGGGGGDGDGGDAKWKSWSVDGGEVPGGGGEGGRGGGAEGVPVARMWHVMEFDQSPAQVCVREYACTCARTHLQGRRRIDV